MSVIPDRRFRGGQFPPMVPCVLRYAGLNRLAVASLALVRLMVRENQIDTFRLIESCRMGSGVLLITVKLP